MKKKVISILLCAAMCVGMVTACGSKKADKDADSSTDEKDKVITVAANGSFYPIIYTDDNGDLTAQYRPAGNTSSRGGNYPCDLYGDGSQQCAPSAVPPGKKGHEAYDPAGRPQGTDLPYGA